MAGGKRSEALGLLRLGGRKEEGTWGESGGGGQMPESWWLTVKSLEIPQEVRQEEEGGEGQDGVTPSFQVGPSTWPSG